MSRPAYPRTKLPRRCALELIANCPGGCTEAILLAHGFTLEFIVNLIREGFATAQTERVVAGGRTLDVARVRITDAGQRMIA